MNSRNVGESVENAVDESVDESADMPPPPLPPRRQSRGPQQPRDHDSASPLQSKPTTALSSVDIQTLSFPDGSRGTFSTSGTRSASFSSPAASFGGYASPGRFGGAGGDLDESMSVMSLAPTLRAPGDLASLVAGGLDAKSGSPAWSLLRSQSTAVPPFAGVDAPELAGFDAEFDPIPDTDGGDTASSAERLRLWKSKLKHYMVLSSAGKPVYSRHGDLGLVNASVGVIQTIISFYERARDPLLGFTAAGARFVVAIEGPLYLVAVSRLAESDAQLRAQLAALYMQILSTLTLPALHSIFAHRPSADLRRPLQGTESLLSSLADSFTRGSPSSLLGALECLRLRRSHRHAINNAFLRCRADKLLYGLIVAGGRLVSVIRPRRHSLHPSDLQLVFNMLFESGSVRPDGGESWIPLCLPAFNNRGYLYMYVSFDDGTATMATSRDDGAAPTSPVAIVLISPDKESFFDLKDMRDRVVQQLARQGSLDLVRASLVAGRPRVPDVAPGSAVSHFLYKSRANVQFCMSALDQVMPTDGQDPGPGQGSSSALLARRRLMTLYHQLHAAVHARHAHLGVLHRVAADASSLAWVTPVFELYCVAGPNVSRALLTHGANKVAQWARKEEERLFIIGGAVF